MRPIGVWIGVDGHQLKAPALAARSTDDTFRTDGRGEQPDLRKLCRVPRASQRVDGDGADHPLYD